jgi:hypothetical protein
LMVVAYFAHRFPAVVVAIVVQVVIPTPQDLARIFVRSCVSGASWVCIQSVLRRTSAPAPSCKPPAPFVFLACSA